MDDEFRDEGLPEEDEEGEFLDRNLEEEA